MTNSNETNNGNVRVSTELFNGLHMCTVLNGNTNAEILQMHLGTYEIYDDPQKAIRQANTDTLINALANGFYAEPKEHEEIRDMFDKYRNRAENPGTDGNEALYARAKTYAIIDVLNILEISLDGVNAGESNK